MLNKTYLAVVIGLLLLMSTKGMTAQLQRSDNKASNQVNSVKIIKNQYTSQYKGSKYEESGPIRFKLVSTQDADIYQSWDTNFNKRHLILREIKKGFTSYMYKLEAKILSIRNYCSVSFNKKYIYVELTAASISANQAYSYIWDLTNLKLKFVMNDLHFEPESLSNLNFERDKRNNYTIKRENRDWLKGYGRSLAREFFRIDNNQQRLKNSLLANQRNENIDCARKHIDRAFKALN